MNLEDIRSSSDGLRGTSSLKALVASMLDRPNRARALDRERAMNELGMGLGAEPQTGGW